MQPAEGSDWMFRMTIEERYKKLATLRGLIRVLAVAQVAYFVLHTAWVLAADFYGGAVCYRTDLLLLPGALVTYVAYRLGFGLWHAARERPVLVMTYCLLTWFLLAESAMTTFWYHVLVHGSGVIGGDYPMRPTYVSRELEAQFGLPTPLVKQALAVGEGLLDVAGLLVMFFNCLSLKDYVVVKRAQKRAQQQEGATESKDDVGKDD